MYLSPFSRYRHGELSVGGTSPGTPLPAGDPDPPTDSVTAASPNLHAKFHLYRSSRLATMHARHRHITYRRLSSAATLRCAPPPKKNSAAAHSSPKFLVQPPLPKKNKRNFDSRKKIVLGLHMIRHILLLGRVCWLRSVL